MALTKEIVINLIEVTETNNVQVREATRVYDDGELIGETFHRHVIANGDDYSGEDPRVQAVCKAVQTKG